MDSMWSKTLTFFALFHVVFARKAIAIPPELYSTVVAQKALTIATKDTAPNAAAFPTLFPQYTARNGSYTTWGPSTWTSSFFPSLLNLLHQRSLLCPSSNDSTLLNTSWLDLERYWGTDLISNVNLTNTHDLGFLSWAFQDEWNNSGGTNTTVKDAILVMADHLAARFNPIVGCTRSWDQGGPDDFEVIIDNMMNLELFFFAHDLTGNQTYINMAISHANKTQQNHVRPDGSSFHVVDYSNSTGQVLWRGTAQGYSNSSTWSRGQAWGIYGFASMYNRTKNPSYLDTARGMASYYIHNLPSFGVPYWDFNAPLNTKPTLDTSSAMIASSAFLFLSTLESSLSPPNTTGSNFYQSAALSLLSNTINLSWNTANDWQSLLGNGTVNNRANPPNNNTGIIYADYFFVESGNRLLEMGLANCTVEGNGTRPTGVGQGTTNESSAARKRYRGLL